MEAELVALLVRLVPTLAVAAAAAQVLLTVVPPGVLRELTGAGELEVVAV